jgi:hypothetical protein
VPSVASAFGADAETPTELMVGEAVDFWRVEERLPPRLLRLRAEMKMPGRAWLEFSVHPDGSGGSVLKQRAVYWPRGIAGHAYWWSVAPFHAFVFPPMARHIVERAESMSQSPALEHASDTIEA